MLLFLLLVGVAIALKSVDNSLPVDIGGYTISRLASAKNVSKPSELKVTNNVVNLRRAQSGVSLSSTFVQAMRKGARTGVERRAANGTTPLQSVEGGHVFLADVLVGGQQFSTVIDTGSSDPWLAVADFACFDVYDDSPQDESFCEFGPLYDSTQSTTYRSVPNMNFNISYADGEYLTGLVGVEAFRMAGINVPNQQFGLVDNAAWFGDGTSSGLIGFAYRTLTSAYAGINPSADKKGQTVLYNPLFVNMYTNQGVPPVFTMAIDRDYYNGGVLALGGIPDVPHVPYFVSTPIIPVGVNVSDGTLVYEFYTIDIDGFALANNTNTQFNPSSNNNPLKQPLVGNGTNIIVDSGTSLVYVPDDVADMLAEMFDPPATWDPSSEAYFVDCGAVAPVFGVSIQDKVFYTNAQDLIVQVSDTMCISGVQPNLGGLNLLGATWMKNVLAVFDIGAEQMRFAARQFYSANASG